MDDLSISLKEEIRCPICLDIIKDPMRIIVCGHRFCKSCIDKCIQDAQKKKCPCCRKEIPTRRHIYKDTKFETIVRIVSQYFHPVRKYKNYNQTVSRSNQIRMILRYDPRFPLTNPYQFKDFQISLNTPISILREYVKSKISKDNDIWEDFMFLFFAQEDSTYLVSIDNESLTIKQIKQIYPDTHSSMILFLTPKIN